MAIYSKPIANSKLNGIKLKAISIKSGRSQSGLLFSYLFNTIFNILARTIRQLKQIKEVQIGNQEATVSYLQMIR